MSDLVQVQYDTLQTLATQFGQQAERIATMKKSLQQSYDPLEGGDWEGKGAGAFFNKMTSEIFPSVDKLSQALQVSSQITQQVMAIFQAAEQEAAAIFKGDGDMSGGDGGRGGSSPSGPSGSGGGRGGLGGIIDFIKKIPSGSLKTIDLGQMWNLPIPLKLDLGKWKVGLGKVSFTSVALTSEGTLIGDKNLGLTGGLTLSGPSISGQIGKDEDGSWGASAGASLVSIKAGLGVNVLGKNVGITAEAGVKWEWGASIGKNTKLKLGPFSFGFSFGGAK